MVIRRDIQPLWYGTRFARCGQRGGTARVWSVHDKVINLIYQDELLALALPQAGGSSRFLCLSSLPNLKVGDTLNLVGGLSGRIKYQDDNAGLNAFSIPLSGLTLWQGPFEPETSADLTPQQLSAFKEALHAVEIQLNLPSIDLSPKTAFCWIGLGQGLTPAGDDVLVGYLAIDNHLGQDRDWTEAMGKAVTAGLHKTTKLSAQLLRCALSRDYHEYIQQVLAILCGTSNENLLTAMRRVAQVGASSGENILYGMWLAMERILRKTGVGHESGTEETATEGTDTEGTDTEGTDTEVTGCPDLSDLFPSTAPKRGSTLV